MALINSSILFYGGLVIAGAAAAALAVLFAFFRVRHTKLKQKLDEEYGKKEK